jgi:hypothetical protein
VPPVVLDSGGTCPVGFSAVDYSFHLLFAKFTVVKDDGGNNNVAFGELMECTLLVSCIPNLKLPDTGACFNGKNQGLSSNGCIICPAAKLLQSDDPFFICKRYNAI